MWPIEKCSEMSTPFDPNTHLCRRSNHEAGKLNQSLFVVPIDRIRHHIDSHGWGSIVFAVRPWCLASAFGKSLILGVLRPVSFQDSAIAVFDDFQKQPLQSVIAGQQSVHADFAE